MSVIVRFFSSLQASLSSSQEKMEAELRSLRLQLEKEKSRNRKMQSDLQKELNVAFDENTKLTSLLDGKVPKGDLELEFKSEARRRARLKPPVFQISLTAWSWREERLPPQRS